MLEIKNVTKVYGEGTTRLSALNTVSFKVEQGDFIAIMGPSGSGKSTLLNVIGGLDRISGGEIYLDGERIDTRDENTLVEVRRGKIAYIFQQYHLVPSLSALENVLLPLIFYRDSRNENEALSLLKRVGLEGRIHHKPGQLSGGEQQRVAIARALVAHPLFILADEPTGNMDQKTGKEILGIFKQLNAEGQSIIMVTHDPGIARYARQIIVLQDGHISDIIDPAKAGM
jgi:putative ABC transport system ATP-binding protein